MASIKINISEDEKLKVLKALKNKQNKIISIAAIAKIAKLNSNRTRFIVEDLLEEKRLVRKEAKNFNPKYIRYTYEVIK